MAEEQLFPRCVPFNDYEIISEIGKGTFGKVYKAAPPLTLTGAKRARTATTNSYVALKQCFMGSKEMPVTALREIKMLRRLDHPNIIRLLDIAVDAAALKRGEFLYLCFDFFEHDMSGLLRNKHAFHPREIACLAKQMLLGLEYLHAADVVHRDMKTANLLVNAHGVLCLADFGFARVLSADDPAARRTPVVCSRWYRPPEVLLSIGAYSSPVDMWGAGCIMAEMFIGEPILQGPERPSDKESDIEQFEITCKLLGNPTQSSWPEFAQSVIRPRGEHHRGLQSRFRKEFRNATHSSVPDAIALVDTLLQFNPAQRPTAAAALTHAFFKAACQPSDVRLPSGEYHELTRRK